MNCCGSRNEGAKAPGAPGGGGCCGSGSVGRKAWIAILVIGGLLLLAGLAKGARAGLLGDLLRKTPADAAKAAGVVETADAVKIPLKALDSGKAIFSSLASDGRTLYFFALRSRDGAYRSALDACDVCYRANRGYRQEGDLMVCNNCGQTFPSDKIGEVKGGCNPHPLKNKVESGYLVISKADVVAGKDNFARKRP